MAKKDNKVHVNDDLPFDIVYNHIFLKLPTKTLVHFRSVCKTWDEIINSPTFRNRHVADKTDRLKQEDTYFALMLDCDMHQTSMVMFPHKIYSSPTRLLIYSPRIYVDIIYSCNGLLCMSSFDTMKLYLYNPMNGEVLKLPKSDRLLCVIGFGFSYTNKEYKVLAWALTYPYYLDPSDDIRICTIPLNGLPTSWTILEHSPEDINFYFASVQVNERLHWYCEHDQDIVSFDLNTNELQFVPMEKLKEKWPRRSPEQASPWIVKLIEFQGLLAFVTESQGSHGFTIWTMEKYGDDESWTMKTSFEHRRNIRKGRCALGWPRYCTSIDENLQVCFPRNFVCYDQRSQRCTYNYKIFQEGCSRTRIRPRNSICFKGNITAYWPQLLPFVANLSPLNGAVKIQECKELFTKTARELVY